MKIIILIPIWKRPELTKKCIEALLKLKPKGIELKVFCMLSPDDPGLLENLSIMKKHNIYFMAAPNKPLGCKKTFGLVNAIGLDKDYDYIMELGSDDFINPKLFDLYGLLISEGVAFFGLNNLYMYSVKQDKLIWVKEYAGEGMTYGAGRMIHRSIIEKLGCDLWDNYNEGLDTMSAKKIKKAGFHETVIDAGEFPYILDVKTDTHICPFEFVEKYCETKEVDIKLLKDFGYENSCNVLN